MRNFLIVTHGRTGSSWLVSLLESNSNLRCFGEILGIPKNEEVPSDFKKTILSKFTKPFNKIVGLKCTYDQIDDDLWELINQYKIIHLHRQNLLDMFLSMTLSSLNQNWELHQYQANSVEIRPDKLLEFFQKYSDLEAMIRLRLPHNTLEIIYENLSKNPKGEILRCTEFLGVEFEEPTSNYTKQNTLKKEKAISNYKEICGCLTGTPYEKYLKEET